MDTLFLITIIVLILYLNVDHYFKNLVTIQSDVNNVEYAVQDNEHKKLNANTLASISRRIQILL